MRCPLCNEEMKKIFVAKNKNRHSSVRCPNCSFVIFYKGVTGLSKELL